MNYENANRRFMQYYRPMRDVQRRYPHLVGPALAYGAVSGINYLRNRFNRLRRSLYGKAAVGAFASLKKNSKMAGVKTPRMKRRTKTPLTPKSPKGVKAKPKQYAIKRGVKSSTKKKSGRPTTVVQSNVAGPMVATRRINRASRKYSILGAEYSTETAGEATSSEQLYIGHANMPKKVVVKLLWSSVIKKLFSMVGNLTSDLSIALPFVVNGDTIRIQQKGSPTGNWANADYTIATIGTNSVKGIIDYFVNLYVTSDVATTFQINNIQFIPAASSVLKYTRLALNSAKFRVKSTCYLTLQNRSFNSVGGDPEAQDLNNCVLRGKVYEGYGSGSSVGSDSVTTHISATYANSSGLISFEQTQNPENELPPGFYFTDARKEGNFIINPGEYKQSVLKDSFVVTFNKFLRYAIGTGNSQQPMTIGKFKIIALEKMIDIFIDQSVKVAYECQMSIGAYMIPGYQNLSMPIAVT